jgi:acetaldehyde dehydrogenase (acetylating)
MIEGSRQRAELFRLAAEQDKKLDSIHAAVTDVQSRVSGYRGFFAGAAWAIGLLGGGVVALAVAIWERVTGGH